MFQLVLLSHQQHIDVGNLSLNAELMGLPKDVPIHVQQTCLMGGKQTGSRLITCEADKTIKMWKEDTEATPESAPILPFAPPKNIRRS